MKSALISGICIALGWIMNANAAGASPLAGNAQEAAKCLPRGSIVLAEQAGEAAPAFFVGGKQEPAGVPPEKVIFEIGSVSKIFTGILLAQAVIEKRVMLDSTVGELMGKEHAFADARVAAITLRQLATHTSGLPRIPEDLFAGADPADPYAHYDRKRLDAYLSQVRLAHAPPFPSSYSNLGVGLLGDLLARLSNRTWKELVLERITRPLGMADTAVTLNTEQMRRLAPPYAGDRPTKPWNGGALAGAGALRSTAADMLKFGQALRSPETTSLQAAIEMIEQPQGEESLGLCLQILKLNGRNTYWFSGGTGGFRSWISVNPPSARVVVMLINNNVLSPEAVLTGQADDATAPKSSTAPPDPALTAYAGQYDTGVKSGATSIYYTLEVRGAELWMQITGQRFVPLTRHPTTQDRFEFKPVEAQLQFTRENGAVVATTLYQQGMEIHARKLSSKGEKP